MKFEKNDMINGNISWEDLNALMSMNLMSQELVQNGRVRSELLRGTRMQQANLLYDAADSYIYRKMYDEAESCLREIEKLNCWKEDETLQPASYSLWASLWFSREILSHSGRKYRKFDFKKSERYARRACECKVSDNLVAKRTKTGAWQVLFCIAVLCGDVFQACVLRAEHNLYFLLYRQRWPFEERNNWYVGNEISEQDIESRFNVLLKVYLYENPERFDELYRLHIEHKSSFNYTESLAFAATFVAHNISRTVILYNDLFEFLTERTTDFETYFFNQCEKLSAIIFSMDLWEIRRTLQVLDELKLENKELFKEMSKKK